jgi:hypothetical protein
MSSQADLEKVLDAAETIKELNRDLKELVNSHEASQKLKELKATTKTEMEKLKKELDEDPDISMTREELSTAKERHSMLKEILVAKMLENDEDEVTAKGKKAMMVKNLKIEKAKSN